MRKIFYLLFLGTGISAGDLFAQEILPNITVKNYNGKIIVSWKNEYPLEVKTINIQRSFDSLKNYTTIGTVLNPQNNENGFVDEKPPYNKMYYRVFIGFDAGAYVFSESVRPVKELPLPSPMITQEITVEPIKKYEPPVKDTKPVVAAEKPADKKASSKNNKRTTAKNKVQLKAKEPEIIIPKEEPITYPSRRIYTARDNNVVINLPNIDINKYIVKFFDEGDKPLFELNRIKEDYLIIEKMNFLRAGWFHFEIYENGRMIEKNKFFIPKDGKIQ